MKDRHLILAIMALCGFNLGLFTGLARGWLIIAPVVGIAVLIGVVIYKSGFIGDAGKHDT